MARRSVFSDVFSLDELAQATGAAPAALQTLVESGRLPLVAGTGLVRGRDAVTIGRWLLDHDARQPFGLSSTEGAHETDGRARVARMSSAGVHVAVAGLLLWATSGPRVVATMEEPTSHTRLVFVVDPGSGSSGGGGVPSRPRPRTRVGRQPPAEVAPAPPPPLEATTFAAPILSTVPTPPSRVSTPEALDRTTRDATTPDGVGPGTTGGIGNTARSGIGEGTGPGEGGAGNGSGRGVTAPRLLREVKATYSEEARGLGITGDVVLSIVVDADGRVGDVRLIRGLGAGLDERAVAAVRGWQFAPARRLGAPVAVTVEAVVSFHLR